MQTQKFLYNFRKQFSCNFEPQATKRTKRGRYAQNYKKIESKNYKNYADAEIFI